MLDCFSPSKPKNAVAFTFFWKCIGFLPASSWTGFEFDGFARSVTTMMVKNSVTYYVASQENLGTHVCGLRFGFTGIIRVVYLVED